MYISTAPTDTISSGNYSFSLSKTEVLIQVFYKFLPTLLQEEMLLQNKRVPALLLHPANLSVISMKQKFDLYNLPIFCAFFGAGQQAE